MNLFTAHAQTLSSQKSPKMVSRARNDSVFLGKRARWIQNVTSDFILKVVIRLKNRQIDEKQRRARTVKISRSCRKSMSLNPFVVTDFRAKVELRHLPHMRRHYCHVWNTRDVELHLNVVNTFIRQASDSNKTLLVLRFPVPHFQLPRSWAIAPRKFEILYPNTCIYARLWTSICCFSNSSYNLHPGPPRSGDHSFPRVVRRTIFLCLRCLWSSINSTDNLNH